MIPVGVGLQQGSSLSPYLFAMSMDVLARGIKDISPWCMLYADDIVLCGTRSEVVETKLEEWRRAMEDRVLKIYRKKTVYLRFNVDRVLDTQTHRQTETHSQQSTTVSIVIGTRSTLRGSKNIYATKGAACVCKIWPISVRTLSFRHQTSRKFFSHSNFPTPYLWTAFCVPLSFVFFTKNNNLECRDVLKTVTVISDQKRFGPYTAHN